MDCGATHTTTIPIHDGYVLNKAVAQSPLGGEFILSKCRQLLEEQLNIEIVPYYSIKSKKKLKNFKLLITTCQLYLDEVQIFNRNF